MKEGRGDMDHEKAKELVDNLLERLCFVGGRYELPGGMISAKEHAALARVETHS